MTAVVGDAGDRAITLHGATASARVVPLGEHPTVAVLNLLDHRFVPTSADITRWLAALVDHGYERVRSGALDERCAEVFARHGFHVVEDLVVMERHAPRPWHRLDLGLAGPRLRRSSGRPRLRTLAPSDLTAVAAVDRAAFHGAWSLDELSIADICQATRHYRARVAIADEQIVGYAVSGRDLEIGFLQRLAVDPSRQRSGIGGALVADVLRWMGRHRVDRVILNTQTDNTPALNLYLGHGFEIRRDHLVVAEATLR